MAAEMVTPIDELSGLPLPIAPTETSIALLESGEVNWHHHFHPELDIRLTRSLGGKALRHCRKQLVRATDHNYGVNSYHNYFFGPPIPENQADQFSVVVLACAGYRSNQAIDIRSGELNIVQLNAEQTAVMYKKKKKSLNEYDYFRYGYEPIRDFFKEYTLEQDMSLVDFVKIEEFLLTKDKNRKKQLGRFLISQVTQIACDGIDVKYKLFKRLGLLHPDSPDDSFTLVEAKLGSDEKRELLISAIQDKIASYFDMKVAI